MHQMIDCEHESRLLKKHAAICSFGVAPALGVVELDLETEGDLLPLGVSSHAAASSFGSRTRL